MWKGCAYANASRNAVFAAMLAARGMTGPSPVFEGVGGYFKAVTRKPFSLDRMGGAGTPYKIMECSIKRFPLGQYSQTVVEAALELRGKVSSAGRDRRSSHRDGDDRHPTHGRRPGQVGAEDARVRGPQHAVHGGRGAHARRNRGEALRRALSARPEASRPHEKNPRGGDGRSRRADAATPCSAG